MTNAACTKLLFIFHLLWLLLLILCLWCREQQLGYAKSPPSPSRPSAASSSSISSSSKYPSSANHKADHWARHRSSAYHMHGCLDLSTDADGTARTGTGGGVALSEGEVRMLTKLLTSTVDGLIDSGGPNVSIISYQLYRLCKNAKMQKFSFRFEHSYYIKLYHMLFVCVAIFFTMCVLLCYLCVCVPISVVGIFFTLWVYFIYSFSVNPY